MTLRVAIPLAVARKVVVRVNVLRDVFRMALSPRVVAQKVSILKAVVPRDEVLLAQEDVHIVSMMTEHRCVTYRYARHRYAMSVC